MTSRAKPLPRSMLGSSLSARHFIVGLAVAVFPLVSVACSSDVQDKRDSTASATASSSSVSSSSGAGGEGVGGAGNGGGGASGGMGGVGGAGGMGTGGATVDGGTQGGEYVAYNLFTHVPRFVVYKVDPVRNLCFRIWLVGFSNPGTLTIDVTSPWVADRAEVTNNVADCTVTMGFPPQPQVFANGTSGMGTITVHGGFPCTVDVHATISFENIGTWVPASESFDVDGLNVDGGCG